MNKLLRSIIVFIGLIAAFLILFMVVMTLTDYQPDEKTVLWETPATPVSLDTFTILSWNIGYAGLNKEMDFFYDGGEQTRTSAQQAAQNLSAIVQFLKSRDATIYFLQEVDRHAHRSYQTNQLAVLSDALSSYKAFYGVNYHVAFVPVPLFNPMGQVESGIATFTKQCPYQATLFSYPSQEAWPTGIFSLDRCFLSVRFLLTNGKELIFINTHNSAFDQGSMRRLEMEYLKSYLLSEYAKGNYIIAGGDWNQNPPLPDSLVHYNTKSQTEYFKPLPIAPDFLPASWQWVSDGYATNRFTNETYKSGRTQETLLDFFVISPNVKAIQMKRIDLGFIYSDHHPIEGTFVIE